MGITIPKAKKALNPYNAIKPGLIMNVAALVIDAAKERATEMEEKDLFPTAYTSMLSDVVLDLYTRYIKPSMNPTSTIKVMV